MAKIQITLETDLNKIQLPNDDGLELPSYAADIINKMLSKSMQETANLDPTQPHFPGRALEERGYRKALIEFSSYFNNSELPK